MSCTYPRKTLSPWWLQKSPVIFHARKSLRLPAAELPSAQGRWAVHHPLRLPPKQHLDTSTGGSHSGARKTRESCGGYKSSTPFLLEWAWHWAGEHLVNIRHLKRDWRAQSQQDQWYPTLWPQPHFWGPLMWGHLNCQFSGAEDVASFRLAHGLYETAAWRQDSAISLNREQDFFSYPSDFWVGVLLQLVQFTLSWNGDYTSPPTGRNSWCFGFCIIKKKLASGQKSSSKKTVGTTVILPTAGLKGGNL